MTITKASDTAFTKTIKQPDLVVTIQLSDMKKKIGLIDSKIADLQNQKDAAQADYDAAIAAGVAEK